METDEMGRAIYKSDKHCKCEMPVWTVENMIYCAKCHKLLPDIKEEPLKCCLCRKEITEEECSNDYSVAMCKQCAREGHHYGWD